MNDPKRPEPEWVKLDREYLGIEWNRDCWDREDKNDFEREITKMVNEMKAEVMRDAIKYYGLKKREAT